MIQKLMTALSEGVLSDVILEVVESENRVHRKGQPAVDGKNVKLQLQTHRAYTGVVFARSQMDNHGFDLYLTTMVKEMLNELDSVDPDPRLMELAHAL